MHLLVDAEDEFGQSDRAWLHRGRLCGRLRMSAGHVTFDASRKVRSIAASGWISDKANIVGMFRGARKDWFFKRPAALTPRTQTTARMKC